MSHLVRGQVGGLPFLRVLGTTPVTGKGKLFQYVIYAERGIDLNKQEFGETVDAILADPKGWTRGGKVSFQRVNRGGNTQIVLAHPDTVDKLCAPLQTEGKVSCCQGSRIVINLERWLHGVPHWGGRLKTYRQALVNHEAGHRIGKNHAFCPGPGEKHPIMMQFTYGMQSCSRNSWPLASEL